MKEIKRILMKENDSIEIKMSEKLINTKINVPPADEGKRKYIFSRLVACVCCFVLILASISIFNNKNSKGVKAADITSYVIEINPSFCLTIDNDTNEVINLFAINDDANVIISDIAGELNDGINLEECVDLIMNEVHLRGYLDELNGYIDIYAICDKKSERKNKLVFIEELVNNKLIDIRKPDVGINKHDMDLDEFKEKTGIEGDFKKLDDMKDIIIEKNKHHTPKNDKK